MHNGTEYYRLALAGMPEFLIRMFRDKGMKCGQAVIATISGLAVLRPIDAMADGQLRGLNLAGDPRAQTALTLLTRRNLPQVSGPEVEIHHREGEGQEKVNPARIRDVMIDGLLWRPIMEKGVPYRAVAFHMVQVTVEDNQLKITAGEGTKITVGVAWEREIPLSEPTAA
ncbi:hypothetical protein KKB40_03495 [Patescibacteria group bacterium]|nr:hypothetical protein [Patescibacteria group bacterium]